MQSNCSARLLLSLLTSNIESNSHSQFAQYCQRGRVALSSPRRFCCSSSSYCTTPPQLKCARSSLNSTVRSCCCSFGQFERLEHRREQVRRMSIVGNMSAEVVEKLKIAKRSLRREIDARLAKLTPDEVNTESAKVHRRLFDSPAYKSARRVGVYLSLPTAEIHTQPILERCFADGKRVFVPSYDFRTRQMEFYELASMADYESLPVEPKYAIKQPELANSVGRAEALSTGGLDLLLVPGVCFSKAGKRLGHGKGYFDTWLARMKQHKDIQVPRTVALALSLQLVDDVPTHEWDFIIDEILTPQ